MVYEMTPSEPSARHLNSHEAPATSDRSYELGEPEPRLGQTTNHSGDSDPPTPHRSDHEHLSQGTNYRLRATGATSLRACLQASHTYHHSGDRRPHHPTVQVKINHPTAQVKGNYSESGYQSVTLTTTQRIPDLKTPPLRSRVTTPPLRTRAKKCKKKALFGSLKAAKNYCIQ